MDPSAVERARKKAEAVRASLQRQQQSVVERRRLEGTPPASIVVAAGGQQQQDAKPTPTPSLPTVGVDNVLQPKSRSFDDSSAAAAPTVTPEVSAMEDVTSAHDEEDSLLLGADSPVLPPESLPSDNTGGEEEPKPDFAVESGALPSLAASPPVSEKMPGDGLVGASVTRQVLSSSSTSSAGGPRYLQYRDSLRSSIKAASVRTATASVASDETIESQLKSYLDRSLPPPARNEAEARPSNQARGDDPDPPGAFGDRADIEEGGASRLESADSSLSPPASTDSAPSSPPPVVGLEALSPDRSGVERRAQGHKVSFNDANDQFKSPRSFEDPSESEGSVPGGTLTRKEYRRRRAMQIGVLVFVFVCSPLAIGLGVAYANRPAPSKDQNESTSPAPTTTAPAPTAPAPTTTIPTTTFPTASPSLSESTGSPSVAISPAASPTSSTQITGAPTIATTAPVPIVPTASPTSLPRDISFPPVTSILDLLAVSGNSTEGDL